VSFTVATLKTDNTLIRIILQGAKVGLFQCYNFWRLNSLARISRIILKETSEKYKRPVCPKGEIFVSD
jgi:hypothetical protein